MKHVLQFKLARSASEEITTEAKNFYTWLCSIVTSTPSGEEDYEFHRTVPIPYAEIHEGAEVVYTTMTSKLSEIAWGQGTDLIIDVILSSASNCRAHILIHLLSALESHVLNLDESIAKHVNIIFLLEELPPDTASIGKKIKHISESISLIVIGDDGRASDEVIPKKEYRKKRILSKHMPGSVVKNKMIRQMGHFRKNVNDADLCCRHFYDGSFGEKELSQYLFIEIAESLGKCSQVLYHAPRSPWLINSVLTLEETLNASLHDLTDGVPSKLNDEFCIVLDFVDTGSSLSKFLASLDKKPTLIISILVTEEQIVDGHKFICYGEDSESIEVQYLDRAAYQNLGPPPCYLCDLGIPVDTLESMKHKGTLRSVDFWEIALQHGTVIENNPPKYRDTEDVRKVINTLDMIKSGGAFIASRIAQFIVQRDITMDCTIVCPAEEAASEILSDQIELILNCSVVKIPRIIIDRYSGIDNPSLTDEEKEQEWYKQLSTSSVTECVIIDDLSVTGKTILGLYNILQKEHKKISHIIPVLSLRSKVSDICDGLITPLYGWETI